MTTARVRQARETCTDDALNGHEPVSRIEENARPAPDGSVEESFIY